MVNTDLRGRKMFVSNWGGGALPHSLGSKADSTHKLDSGNFVYFIEKLELYG